VFPRLDITQKAAKPERLFFCFERDLFTLPKCKDDARILLHNQFFDLLLFRVDSGKIFSLERTFDHNPSLTDDA
jgi:hypothetical protein